MSSNLCDMLMSSISKQLTSYIDYQLIRMNYINGFRKITFFVILGHIFGQFVSFFIFYPLVVLLCPTSIEVND